MPSHASQPIIIEESGMTFGPFAPNEIFYIEKCTVRGEHNAFPVVEFVRIINDSSKFILEFVEAKKSSPNVKSRCPNNTEECNLRQYPFKYYINTVQNKFIGSITLLMGLLHNRHTNYKPDLPDDFRSLNFGNISKICCILVINKFNADWLRPVQDMLRPRMLSFFNLWGLKSCIETIVLNDEMAVKRELIQDSVPCKAQ